MGDHGDIYPVYEGELCRRMKELVALSDIVTPNVTEACILTDTPLSGKLPKVRTYLYGRGNLRYGTGKGCYHGGGPWQFHRQPLL